MNTHEFNSKVKDIYDTQGEQEVINYIEDELQCTTNDAQGILQAIINQ